MQIYKYYSKKLSLFFVFNKYQLLTVVFYTYFITKVYLDSHSKTLFNCAYSFSSSPFVASICIEKIAKNGVCKLLVVR